MMSNLRGRSRDNYIVITCRSFSSWLRFCHRRDGVWEPPVRNTANKVDLLLCPPRPQCDSMICAGLGSRQRSNSPIYFVYSFTAAEAPAGGNGTRLVHKLGSEASAKRFIRLPPEIRLRLSLKSKCNLRFVQIRLVAGAWLAAPPYSSSALC